MAVNETGCMFATHHSPSSLVLEGQHRCLLGTLLPAAFTSESPMSTRHYTGSLYIKEQNHAVSSAGFPDHLQLDFPQRGSLELALGNPKLGDPSGRCSS